MMTSGSSSVDSCFSSLSVNPTFPPLPTGEYEVFMSFRGPDVRQTFADFLYSCLVRSKIRTFRDEEELPKGETLGPSLVKAITESKICIPIFTQRYASSKWCLQELAKMVECWKTGKGHLILPIFYLMDPRDVRHHEAGPYKEAFEQHSLKHDPQTVMEWREALQEVGQMKGWHVTESNGQGAILDQILTKVELHLRANYTLVNDELVGINFHVEKVMELLNLDSTSEKVVGIHGMGGLGKTTLAKAVFDKASMHFDRCCFLEDVREILSEIDGVVTMQNKIISSILRNDSDAKNVGDGMQIIKDRVCRHKLLIVLDDVDERFQFEDIVGKLCNFSTDSRFLITTRNARVLELLQECKLYELGEMSHDYALNLFSKHAFGVDYPPEDYANLSEEFVQVAAGLPLALKVIGSLLFHTNKRFWEAKLIELKEIPPAKVQERLKISYNELTYNEKQIFLDVACLFIGVDKELPFHMWNDCNFYPESGLRTLVQRCLLRLNENKEFWMHDHVRDLGRAIVREESIQKPYKRSRVWSNKEALTMLKNGQGSDSVEVLRVDMEGEDHALTNQEFAKLSGLRYLEVRNGRLVGNFKEVLPNIRFLGLYSCDSVPTDVNLQKLVNLSLVNCPVKDGWRGWNEIKVAQKLKVCTLSGCHKLEKVPDLTSCGGLELLEFIGCRWMDGVLDIGNFKNLRLLRVKWTPIKKLKGEIGMLQNLHTIDVRDSLSISSFSLPALPSSLNYLKLCFCMHFERVPCLANLTNLTGLNLHKVGIREILGLGELKLLETLCIFQAPNLANLDGLQNLELLKELTVQACAVLGKLPSLEKLTKLNKLEIGWCGALAKIHGMGELGESLSHLEIISCSSLVDMEVVHSMLKLETLILKDIPLTDLKNLRELKIRYCKNLIEVKGLDRLESLEVLVLWVCRSIKKLPDLSGLKSLKKLDVSGCKQLTEVKGLGSLHSLEDLSMLNCRSVKELPNLSGLKKLRKLNLRKCRQLNEVNGLEGLELLQELETDKRLKVKHVLKLVVGFGRQLLTE
ncbi:Disease resistance protein L6 [Linum perenne]